MVWLQHTWFLHSPADGQWARVSLLATVNNAAMSSVAYTPGFFLKLRLFLSSISLAHLRTIYPGESGINKAPSTPTTRCQRCTIWKRDGLTTSNTNHMPMWFAQRQKIARKSCSLATSLPILHFILELN